MRSFAQHIADLIFGIIIIASIAVATYSAPAAAFGDTHCSGHSCNTDNSTTNEGGSGGSATTGPITNQQGQQQGISHSGNSANVNTNRNHNTNRNTNSQGQNQGQGQGQSQYGSVKNVGPQVSIDQAFNYEEAASAVSTPNVGVATPTAECRYSSGVSIGGSAVGGSGAAGGSWSNVDPACMMQQVRVMMAHMLSEEAQQVVDYAAFCVSFEQAGIDTYFCRDWRDAVAFTPDELYAREVDASRQGVAIPSHDTRN